MNKVRIVWATNSADGTVRHISEVPKGLACGCVCPGCASKLEAVNSENTNWKKRPHFRHCDAPETNKCSQTAAFAGAKHILANLKKIALPGIPAQRASHAPADGFDAASKPELAVISAIEFVDYADAIMTLDDGRQVYVRLVATATPRSNDAKQTRLAEIEIDIFDPVLRAANPDAIRQRLSLSPSACHWCHGHRASSPNAEQARPADFFSDKAADASQNMGMETNAPSLPAGQARKPMQPRVATRIADPQEFNWSPFAPSAKKLAESAQMYKRIWRQWDWAAIVEAGNQARLEGVTVALALDRTSRQFRLPSSPDTIRRAWIQAGILSAIHKA